MGSSLSAVSATTASPWSSARPEVTGPWSCGSPVAQQLRRFRQDARPSLARVHHLSVTSSPGAAARAKKACVPSFARPDLISLCPPVAQRAPRPCPGQRDPTGQLRHRLAAALRPSPSQIDVSSQTVHALPRRHEAVRHTRARITATAVKNPIGDRPRDEHESSELSAARAVSRLGRWRDTPRPRQEPGSGWRDRRHRSHRAAVLECPVLDIEDSAATGIDRWGDDGVADGDDTLAGAELAARPEAHVPPCPRPLEHHDGLEAGVVLLAAVDLELVRLHSDLILSPRRVAVVRCVRLHEFDVRIRIDDLYRRGTAARAGLVDSQRWLVVL